LRNDKNGSLAPRRLDSLLAEHLRFTPS